MNPDRQQAIEYLRAPANGLWHWAEDGAVLVWHDDSTICFREEIVQILEWLVPNGLPSFGAIVFLLAACRGKVPTVAEIVTESQAMLPAAMSAQAALLFGARQQLKLQLGAALGHLATASQLPAELKSGSKARCVLAEAVFEPAKAERHVDARMVLRGMQEPFTDADLEDPERAAVSGSYIRQIHIVAEGLKLHSPESLALRLRTGLDSLPRETEASLTTAERARHLIEELSRDPEHGAVARAARELMAAIRLPRRLAEREQLAIGGVADITNRGPLDRLLLSELAHDDLTLSVRVALNEALYLRREPPMREPPGTLGLLLDSGIRLWGVPRVLSTAVALALVARDKQHAKVLAWRAHGKQLKPVDLLSRPGLTEHLGALETGAHPGESLAPFAEAIGRDARSQSVLITHRDALDDPEFRRALAESPVPPGFVAVIDRGGRFELHTLPLVRRPPICEADLDLGSVFAEKLRVPIIKKDIDPDLPAIFGLSPFPFLLPISGRVEFWIKADDGFTYAVLNDRRLVQFRGQQAGGRVLATELPGGKTLWMDCVNGTVHVFKAGAHQRPAKLLSLPLADGELRVTELATGSTMQSVHRTGEVLLVIRTHDVRAYALSDGRLLGRVLNPHQWTNGRFLRGHDHFYFALWDGAEVRFEEVPLPKPFSPSVISLVFDRTGLEGPWLVHRGGLVISSATGEERRVPMPAGRSFGLDAARVSRDGHRLYVSMPSAQWGQLIDLENDQFHSIKPSQSAQVYLDPTVPLPTWKLYRVAEPIAILPDGFAFCGRRNRWRKVLSTETDIRIIDSSAQHPKDPGTISFGAVAKRANYGCSLQVAEWPNGSKAFLDSRGLLHFKSRNPSVPEVSLVLADGEVAGWSSDGQVCGSSFFFEGARQSEPLRVFESLMQILKPL
jgi:hypothetical protein